MIMNLERCTTYSSETSLLSTEKSWLMLSVCLEAPLGTSLLHTSSSLSVSLVECYDKEKCRTHESLSQAFGDIY